VHPLLLLQQLALQAVVEHLHQKRRKRRRKRRRRKPSRDCPLSSADSLENSFPGIPWILIK
jgi:hypothetical protein